VGPAGTQPISGIMPALRPLQPGVRRAQREYSSGSSQDSLQNYSSARAAACMSKGSSARDALDPRGRLVQRVMRLSLCTPTRPLGQHLNTV
jgi:hypothetical protein